MWFASTITFKANDKVMAVIKRNADVFILQFIRASDIFPPLVGPGQALNGRK